MTFEGYRQCMSELGFYPTLESVLLVDPISQVLLCSLSRLLFFSHPLQGAVSVSSHPSHCPDSVPVSPVWLPCMCEFWELCLTTYVCDSAEASIHNCQQLPASRSAPAGCAVHGICLLRWLSPGWLRWTLPVAARGTVCQLPLLSPGPFCSCK